MCTATPVETEKILLPSKVWYGGQIRQAYMRNVRHCPWHAVVFSTWPGYWFEKVKALRENGRYKMQRDNGVRKITTLQPSKLTADSGGIIYGWENCQSLQTGHLMITQKRASSFPREKPGRRPQTRASIATMQQTDVVCICHDAWRRRQLGGLREVTAINT